MVEGFGCPSEHFNFILRPLGSGQGRELSRGGGGTQSDLHSRRIWLAGEATADSGLGRGRGGVLFGSAEFKMLGRVIELGVAVGVQGSPLRAKCRRLES